MKSYKQGDHNLWIRFSIDHKDVIFVREVGLDHLAFEVKGKNDVDALYEVVKTLNVKITRKPELYPDYSPSYYAFYFRDPDNIPLEIYKQ